MLMLVLLQQHLMVLLGRCSLDEAPARARRSPGLEQAGGEVWACLHCLAQAPTLALAVKHLGVAEAEYCLLIPPWGSEAAVAGREEAGWARRQWQLARPPWRPR